MDAPPALRFVPADLASHSHLCVRFREDMFQLAWGTTLPLHDQDGQGAVRYLEWLAGLQQRLPGSVIHVWSGNEVVGQMEMSQPRPEFGYVHLFYLTESYRQRGLGQQLHAHAVGFFRTLGCSSLGLSASPDNLRAVRFYRRNGWRNIGPRQDDPRLHAYERRLE